MAAIGSAFIAISFFCSDGFLPASTPASTPPKCKTLPFGWGGQTYYDCRPPTWSPFSQKIYQSLFFLFGFVIPFLFQSFSYGSISKKLLTEKMVDGIRMPLRKNKERDTAKVINCQKRKLFGNYPHYKVYFCNLIHAL